MTFQIAAFILAGVFGGLKLDAWLNTKPLFTVVLSLAAAIGSMVFIIRGLTRK